VKLTRAFAHHKAVPIGIPRPRRPLRLIIPLAERSAHGESQGMKLHMLELNSSKPKLSTHCMPTAPPARHKAAKAHGDDGSLAAASNHNISISIADVVGSCNGRTANEEALLQSGPMMHVVRLGLVSSHLAWLLALT
jgi:hypothetical protein